MSLDAASKSMTGKALSSVYSDEGAFLNLPRWNIFPNVYAFLSTPMIQFNYRSEVDQAEYILFRVM